MLGCLDAYYGVHMVLLINSMRTIMPQFCSPFWGSGDFEHERGVYHWR